MKGMNRNDYFIIKNAIQKSTNQPRIKLTANGLKRGFD